MIFKLLERVLKPTRPPYNAQSRIHFICATRPTEENFWQYSAMGRSITDLTKYSPYLTWNIANANTAGLPLIYNVGLQAANMCDIAVFLHDDICLAPLFLNALRKGLDVFDIVGVAGNIRYLSSQLGWLYERLNEIEGFVQTPPDYRAGESLQDTLGQFERVRYGLTSVACDLHFDARFDFHFYDPHFCRIARLHGLSLVIHESGGVLGSPAWCGHYENTWQSWHRTSSCA